MTIYLLDLDLRLFLVEHSVFSLDDEKACSVEHHLEYEQKVACLVDHHLEKEKVVWFVEHLLE